MTAFIRRTALIGLSVICLSGEASGETRTLEIEIDPIIMLNCVDRVDLTLDTADLLTAGRGAAPTIRTIATSANSSRKIEARFTADDLLNTTRETLVEIEIPDACTLRGLGRGEGFLVNVRPANNAALENTSGDGLLAVRDAMGRPGYGGPFARRFSIPQSRVRLDTPIPLDVQLYVDLGYATGSGRYSSPVDGVFSIEVSAP